MNKLKKSVVPAKALLKTNGVTAKNEGLPPKSSPTTPTNSKKIKFHFLGGNIYV